MNSSPYTDSKVLRVTSICLRVLGGETMTARQIAEEYGGSLRTAQRTVLAVERLVPVLLELRGNKALEIRVLPGGGAR